ncbi:MAG: CDC48 family AAA ATPase [Candidatus Woesearchaeota archaeon]
MAIKEKELKVDISNQTDINKGIVRIDTNTLQELELKPGDILEIEGKRKTVAIADEAFTNDVGSNIIRMDGTTRKNAKTGISETVKIRKIEYKEAKSIIIAPAEAKVRIWGDTRPLLNGLIGRPFIKGDEVTFGAYDDGLLGIRNVKLKFVVVDTNPKQPVMISESTELTLNPEAVEITEEANMPDINYEDIGGLQEEVGKVREMVELPLKHPELFEKLGIEPPKGVLLYGPPGTGKTLLARAVANETKANFIEMKSGSIISGVPGITEKNIAKIFEDATKNAPSIIFIDELDSIAFKREERGHNEFLNTPVMELLKHLDGLKSRGKVIVIGATNRPNALDPALRRPGRLDRELEIGIPTKPARAEILKIHTRYMPLEKNVDLNELAAITHGFVGADISALVKEAAMVLLKRMLPGLELDKNEPIPKEMLEKLKVSMDDFKQALKFVRPSALREFSIDIPNIKWEDIGGLEEIKQELKEAVEWPIKNGEAFKRLGVKPPKGILIYGAPGTGKTLLAKAVANESEANFIPVKGPELLVTWVGESEKAIRKLFEKARQSSPSIIFFDEIESLAPARTNSANESEVSRNVVNQILTELDGLEDMNDVIIIGATNRPDMLDPALLRPGRFDRIILAETPDEKTRDAIFKVHTKNMPLKNVDIAKLANKTDGYVGADIESICKEAAIFALRKDMQAKNVTMKDFEEALKKVRPSVTPEIIEEYLKMQDHFKAAKAKQMKEERPRYMG